MDEDFFSDDFFYEEAAKAVQPRPVNSGAVGAAVVHHGVYAKAHATPRVGAAQRYAPAIAGAHENRSLWVQLGQQRVFFAQPAAADIYLATKPAQ